MCAQSSGILSKRAYDYSALAELRRKQAIGCLHPAQREALIAAARYAQKRSVALRASDAMKPAPARAFYAARCLDCATANSDQSVSALRLPELVG